MDSAKRERAQRRWHLLAEAVQQQKIGGNASSFSGFQGYELFEKKRPTNGNEGQAYEEVIYAHPPLDLELVMHHRRPGSQFSSHELSSFDNTGNIRVWPAEEVLAYFLCTDEELSRTLSSRTSPLRILEVAAGMTGMASLFLAQYLSKLVTVDTFITVTDGNEQCAQHIEELAKLNVRKGLLNPSDRIHLDIMTLKWENVQEVWGDRRQTFHLIIAADCLFLEQYHKDLLHLVDFLLSEDGCFILLAPSRGGSRRRFQQLAKTFNFEVEETQRYSEILWSRHALLLDQIESSDNVYEPLNHYPTLLQIRRGKFFEEQ